VLPLYSAKAMSTSLRGHVALVTGANHGIGAATARMLAMRGTAVVVSYLRIRDPGDRGGPQLYRDNRASDARKVSAAIQELGGSVLTVEADLSDARTAARLFDAAEANFGPSELVVLLWDADDC
jgi:3-oxoacyl-[acyl-carrier protein] reductase